jgi:hypothetical protein
VHDVQFQVLDVGADEPPPPLRCWKDTVLLVPDKRYRLAMRFSDYSDPNLGVGFAIPNLTLRLSELASPAWRGRVFSGLVAGIFLGQFVSPLVVQPLIHTAGVGDAFTWTGAVMVAGAVVAPVAAWKRNTLNERTVR